MPTIATIKAKLNDAENRVLSEWSGAGSVKRRWFAFAGGVAVGFVAGWYAHGKTHPDTAALNNGWVQVQPGLSVKVTADPPIPYEAKP